MYSGDPLLLFMVASLTLCQFVVARDETRFVLTTWFKRPLDQPLAELEQHLSDNPIAFKSKQQTVYLTNPTYPTPMTMEMKARLIGRPMNGTEMNALRNHTRNLVNHFLPANNTVIAVKYKHEAMLSVKVSNRGREETHILV